MDRLNRYILELQFLGLIFGGRGLEKHTDDDYIPGDDDMTNILTLNVLNLFKNLRTVRINGVRDYPFSLYQLVLLLGHTKIEEFAVFEDKEHSWFSCLWCGKSSSLIQAYKKKGYAIELYDCTPYVEEISIKLL